MRGYEEAAEVWRELGREAPAWRCTAGAVRAMVHLGVQPLQSFLDRGIDRAVDRGLLPLEVELRTARGLAGVAYDPHRAEEDLVRALDLAEECGLVVEAGRVRMHWAVRLPGDPRRHLERLEVAEVLLVGDRPYEALTTLARARLLATFDLPAARQCARQAAERAAAVEMTGAAEVARHLLRQLGG